MPVPCHSGSQCPERGAMEFIGEEQHLPSPRDQSPVRFAVRPASTKAYLSYSHIKSSVCSCGMKSCCSRLLHRTVVLQQTHQAPQTVSLKWVSQSTAPNARLCEDSGPFLYVDRMVTSPPDSHYLAAITMVNDRGLSSSVSCPSPSILEELRCAAPIQCHELAIRLAYKLPLVLLDKLSRISKFQSTHSHHNTAYTNIWTQSFPNPCAFPENTEDSVQRRW